MRLRSLESFWLLENGLMYTYPSLNTSVSASIVVLGGGITGALISDALLDKGYDVILLDKRDIGQGSTAASTSMIQYELDVKLVDLIPMIGESAAVTCYREGINAVRGLGELVQRRKIECGFESKQSLFLADTEKNAGKLYEEYLARNKFNLGVQWLSREEVFNKYSINSCGAILSNDAASMDAYRCAHALIRQNIQRGLRVWDQTIITNISYDEHRIILTTEGGRVVCDKIIFCTGFETTAMLKENVAELFYTYAVISEENATFNKTLNEVIIWDTANPYFYMRTTPTGRVLIGGEDSETRLWPFEQTRRDARGKRLEQKLKSINPSTVFIQDFVWSGMFGSTKDGLPYIGASPEYNNALFVLGFGGNGITYSFQGRDIICDILDGKENELSHYYRFGR